MPAKRMCAIAEKRNAPKATIKVTINASHQSSMWYATASIAAMTPLNPSISAHNITIVRMSLRNMRRACRRSSRSLVPGEDSALGIARSSLSESRAGLSQVTTTKAPQPTTGIPTSSHGESRTLPIASIQIPSAHSVRSAAHALCSAILGTSPLWASSARRLSARVGGGRCNPRRSPSTR